VIAISDYQDENLEDLDFCKNDGKEMSNTLKNIGYEITEDRYLVGEINYEKMKKSLIKFFQDDNVGPQDILLVYFSGHGVLDGYGGRFFATSQTNTKYPEEYSVSFDFLTEQMKKSSSEKKVAILDCCFSGDTFSSTTGKSAGGAKGEKQAEELGREALSRQFEGSQGNCVLASSLSNRRSYQLPDKPFSAFTYFAIEGLKKNKDSIDGDCCVTPETLSQYIFSKLRQIKGLNQKPVRNISVAGKIILAEYPELRTSLQKKAALEKTVEVKKLKSKQRNQVAIIITAAVLGILGVSAVALSPTAEQEEISDMKKTIEEIKNEMKTLRESAGLSSQIDFNGPKGVSEEILTPLEELDQEIASLQAQLIELNEEPKVDIDYLVDLANVSWNSGDLDKAKDLYDQILDIDETNFEALYGKASVLYFTGVNGKPENFEPALVLIDKALETNPDDFWSIWMRGNILRAQGDKDGAFEMFFKMYEVDKQNFDALNGMGIVLDEKGDLEQALPWYEKALEIQPENQAIQNRIQWIKETLNLEINNLIKTKILN